MHWVIQENIFNEAGYSELLDVLTRFEIPHTVVKVVPFDCRTIPDITVENPVIIMGAVTMWRVAAEKNWTPGSFINSNFDYVVQVEHWGDNMFNFACKVHKFSEVPEQTEDFFIRPIHDTKAFTGYVTDWKEFESWRKSIMDIQTSYCSIKADDLVQVGPVQEIWTEHRVWIVNNEVITSSIYKRGNKPFYSADVDDNVIEFAKRMISIWTPAKAFCLDVFTGPNGPKIGEINNINSAGFYAANIQKLVLTLNEMTGT